MTQVNFKTLEESVNAVRRWASEDGAQMVQKLPDIYAMRACCFQLLASYDHYRQRSETLSDVLIDAAAHGMVLRQSKDVSPAEDA